MVDFPASDSELESVLGFFGYTIHYSTATELIEEITITGYLQFLDELPDGVYDTIEKYGKFTSRDFDMDVGAFKFSEMARELFKVYKL